MKKLKPAAGIMSLALAMVLTACTATAQTLPDLSGMGTVSVISREEGSGTRTEFESLIGTTEDGSTQVALSTGEVLKQVSSDANAIGYLAASALKDDAGVKALAVDGVALSTAAIEQGEYPLCRNYVLAYTGELSDVETDFIAYIQSAGQAIVAQTCIPVEKETSFLSDKSAGTITISGSSSMSALMEQLVEGYAAYNPNAVITVTTTDSTSGLNDAMRGDSDLAMSSRSLKDYEAELLETKLIATDGMAVIVNAASPLENLSRSQIQAIYDGSVENWADLK